MPWFPVEEEDVEKEEAEEDKEPMEIWPCPTSMDFCVDMVLVGERRPGCGHAATLGLKGALCNTASCLGGTRKLVS